MTIPEPNKIKTVKDHYEEHLGNFYSWMTGDFQTNSDAFKRFLIQHHIRPLSNKLAIDLGAGHGIQSIPLAQLGFQVLAIDFNQQLLEELKTHAKNLNIRIVHDDIKNHKVHAEKAELIVCCGDTLSHLENKNEVKSFLAGLVSALDKKGQLILSFRDYSSALSGIDRFIPVKSDESRILTCILDYEEEHVFVTDLLYEKNKMDWQQKVSTYKKVRLLAHEIIEDLKAMGMNILFNQEVNRLSTLIATKQ